MSHFMIQIRYLIFVGVKKSHVHHVITNGSYILYVLSNMHLLRIKIFRSITDIITPHNWLIEKSKMSLQILSFNHYPVLHVMNQICIHFLLLLSLMKDLHMTLIQIMIQPITYQTLNKFIMIIGQNFNQFVIIPIYWLNLIIIHIMIFDFNIGIITTLAQNTRWQLAASTKKNCDGISKSDANVNLKMFHFIYSLTRNQQTEFTELLSLFKPYTLSSIEHAPNFSHTNE